MSIYAIVGTSIVVHREEWMPLPKGAIEMAEGRPFDNAIAQADGTWIDPPIYPKTRLAEIDLESNRPMRAIIAGTATQEDRDKLAALEAEAIQIRSQLAS